MALGKKTGGRQLGTLNKGTIAVKERIAAFGCDYLAYLCHTVNNNVPCAVCRGKGKTPFQPGGNSDEPKNRTCQSCWGSKLERTDPKQSAWAAAELMQYCEAKRKAIEVTGAEGGPVDMSMRVLFVEAENGKPKS